MHSFSRRISLFHYVLNYMSVSAFHRNHVIHHLHGDTFSSFYWKIILYTPKCIYHNYPSSFFCAHGVTTCLSEGQPTFFSIWTGWVCDNHATAVCGTAIRELNILYSLEAICHQRGKVVRLQEQGLPVLRFCFLWSHRLGLWAPGSYCFKHPEDSAVSALSVASWFKHIL